MAAYAAVVSLHHTINALLLNSTSPSSSREILELAYKEASSLLQVLEGLNGSNRSRSSMERVDALEGQIRDSAHKLEDFLESLELELEEEEEDGDEGEIRQEIPSFGDHNADEDTTTGSSEIDFGVEMIGHSGLFKKILREHVLYRMRPDDRYVFVFDGEEGSGARVVAKNVFENSRKAGKFERWGWARVREYDLKHVLMSLIAQVKPHHVDLDDELLSVDASEDELSEYLYKALVNRSYMIVLDGVDDKELLDYLLNKSFPDQGKGSAILVTTISREVVLYGDINYNYELPDISEEIWNEIRYLFFGRDSIPPELEVAGKEIVHNCRLLRVSVAKTIIFLHKSDKTVEQWNKLAADKENIIFTVADEISECNEIMKEIRYIQTHVAEGASDFVSFSLQLEDVSIVMFPQRLFSNMQIISFFGMKGIGKTNFVRNIFKDNSTFSHFDHHVWIPTGEKYQTKEILNDILAQIYPHIPTLHMHGDQKLMGDLCERVSNKRCLIVLDDLCSEAPLHYLREIFPAITGTILVTTTLLEVAKFGRDDTTIEMQLLDKEESWYLLCRKVFEGGLFPPELEKAGRKIAEKCDCLPLLILTVADQLCKVEQSKEYWENVASGKENSIFKNAHQQIYSAPPAFYHNLPQRLKTCFLYLGVFIEKYFIPTSNLANLWICEGLLKPNMTQKMEEEFITKCLCELVDKSLLMVQRNDSDSRISTCRLHSIFWYLSNIEAQKIKFFHAMNSYYDDFSIGNIANQYRLCIRDNILLSLKKVQKLVASNTSVHSFLCIGPIHQYPVPLNFDLKLLRVMNALTIRLYEFPIEVTSLFRLRYLSLTCNGELPASISKLRKLQCLIVKRYMNIESSKISPYMPSEIWDMMELKHLQIMGGCLPDHRRGFGLLKLSTLLEVSAQSCREDVLKWIPNLKSLGIRIEVAPTDESYSFLNLNDIYHLDRLESLKCVVVNPQFGSKTVPPSTVISMFPPSLKRLSLSGLQYPWEHMSRIGNLKNLEVLKLKCYAFRGPKWEMNSTSQFENLKFLLLEDSDLINWKLIGRTDLFVERLCIKHCYKLQELPTSLFAAGGLKMIEIVDCPLLVTKDEKTRRVRASHEVNIQCCSWLPDAHRHRE